MVRAEQLTDAVSQHGEGPVWSTTWGGFRWVDMMAGDIMHLDYSDGQISRWHVGSVAAAFRPRSTGGAVIATEREFLVCDEIGGSLRSLGEVFGDRGIRFNDGACDPAGRFLCGTMAYDETVGAGSLYRCNADGTTEVVLAGVSISNGLAWTADFSRAYYNDTPTGQIDVFDSDASGALLNRRPFVTIGAATGSPDGLAVDSEGGVWTALWGGHAVHHYSAAGVLEDVVEVPTSQVTACTFGGSNLTDLYITTSMQGADPDDTRAGAVFRCAAGIVGLPPLPFAG